MRKILFRGKHKTSKNEWIYGYPVWMPAKQRIVMIPVNNGAETLGELRGFMLKIDGSTLGQYTGLVDRKGTKIFEGDIVRYSSCGEFFQDYVVSIGTYNIHDEMNCAPAYEMAVYLTVVNSNPHIRNGYTTAAYVIDGKMALFPAHVVATPEGVDSLILEVIGNIHDNPELLETPNNDH